MPKQFATPAFFRFVAGLLLVVAGVLLGVHQWAGAGAVLVLAAALFAVAFTRGRLRKGGRRW